MRVAAECEFNSVEVLLHAVDVQLDSVEVQPNSTEVQLDYVEVDSVEIELLVAAVIPVHSVLYFFSPAEAALLNC